MIWIASAKSFIKVIVHLLLGPEVKTLILTTYYGHFNVQKISIILYSRAESENVHFHQLMIMAAIFKLTSF